MPSYILLALKYLLHTEYHDTSSKHVIPSPGIIQASATCHTTSKMSPYHRWIHTYTIALKNSMHSFNELHPVPMPPHAFTMLPSVYQSTIILIQPLLSRSYHAFFDSNNEQPCCWYRLLISVYSHIAVPSCSRLCHTQRHKSLKTHSNASSPCRVSTYTPFLASLT